MVENVPIYGDSCTHNFVLYISYTLPDHQFRHLLSMFSENVIKLIFLYCVEEIA